MTPARSLAAQVHALHAAAALIEQAGIAGLWLTIGAGPVSIQVPAALASPCAASTASPGPACLNASRAAVPGDKVRPAAYLLGLLARSWQAITYPQQTPVASSSVPPVACGPPQHWVACHQALSAWYHQRSRLPRDTETVLVS